MTNEEARQEGNQQQPLLAQNSEISKEVCSPEDEAIKQFTKIKVALAGSQPEWRLPKVDEKALASEPKLVEPPVSTSCEIIVG